MFPFFLCTCYCLIFCVKTCCDQRAFAFFIPAAMAANNWILDEKFRMSAKCH